MSFLKPVFIPSSFSHYIPRAGPSRLPAFPRSQPLPLRHASTGVDFDPTSDESNSVDASLQKSEIREDADEYDFDNERGPADREDDSSSAGFGGFAAARARRDGKPGREERVKPDQPGYNSWLRTVGALYKEPPANGPNWLGKEIVRDWQE